VNETKGTMRIYVVMKNDFPEAVFSKADSASDYIAVQPKHINGRRLYWHMHSFVLDMMEIIHERD